MIRVLHISNSLSRYLRGLRIGSVQNRKFHRLSRDSVYKTINIKYYLGAKCDNSCLITKLYSKSRW